EYHVLSFDGTGKTNIVHVVKDVEMTKYFFIHGGIIEYSVIDEKFSWAFPSNFPIPFEGKLVLAENVWVAGNLIFTKMRTSSSMYKPHRICIQLFDSQKMKYVNVLEDIDF